MFFFVKKKIKKPDYARREITMYFSGFWTNKKQYYVFL